LAALTFVDTNVLAYAYDADSGEKGERAREVLAEIDGAVVSTQVLLELFAVLTRKLGLTREVAEEATESLMDLEVVATDARLVREGLRISRDHDISHWDGMIIAAAAASGCEVLLTQDLNDGQVIESVRVVNPFPA
jgi:predicted nucleic acid-binding protein